LGLFKLELHGVVSSVERVVARGLVRPQLDQPLPGRLENGCKLFPDRHHVPMETDARRLKEEEVADVRHVYIEWDYGTVSGAMLH
jgi:hypothetical protein